MYDFFDHGDDYAVIVFGDVSGKGAAAALYGALISGLLRTLAPRRRSPAVLMQSLNEALLERKVDAQYATLLVALWEPRTRRLTHVQCGRGAAVRFIAMASDLSRRRRACRSACWRRANTKRSSFKPKSAILFCSIRTAWRIS